MNPLYLLTGAAGHLGGAVVRALQARGARVRALVLPQEYNAARKNLGENIELVRGDVRDCNSMIPFFNCPAETPRIVIHMAGIVSIQSKPDPMVYDVNVNGTKNILALCRAYGVQRLVYVSSVHAIPEQPKGTRMAEVSHFDSTLVHGYYAKTKAEATQAVLDAAAAGLDACVVHPSGIIGPYDNGRGHISQMIIDFACGSLRAGVCGGYDFVDVRDVADGIVSCCANGRAGECYILSGHYTSVPELLQSLSEVTGRKPVSLMLPLWLAKATAPLAELYYKLRKQPPLYTRYSLYTLQSNALFSHAKAMVELGYSARPLAETLRDTVSWMRAHKRLAGIAAPHAGQTAA